MRHFPTVTLKEVVDSFCPGGDVDGSFYKSFGHMGDVFFDDMFRRSAIYFLLNGKECVYIGQTKNLLPRIVQHWVGRDGDRKVFDGFKYLFVDPSDINLIEKIYISTFIPKHNTHNTGVVETEYGTSAWWWLADYGLNGTVPPGINKESIRYAHLRLKTEPMMELIDRSNAHE